ncbi:hypothetical protein INT47_008120 [Mucor saturninus]|uniref:PH domain-containing protein n=1 Tax=Mucor saturninus TaxID=64648 RepID=A0A8H7V3N0_9FUNG|nr:hypothetical protein INT47_008120 [Mucor saturninus]
MQNQYNHSSIPNNTQEVPITAHIFEGHLYLRENDKWIWRLFRFDGSSLTCLSSKKNKLPPHTLLDPPLVIDNRPMSFLTSSATTNSLTSPLLATTKNRSVSLSINDTPAIASYYQLPKWTIDMVQISTISILKPKDNNRKTFSFTAPSRPKSFSIRTYDGGCYIMKAHKQDDLERWIFVLAKMWKVSQAARQLYQPVSPTKSYSLNQQQQQQYHNATPTLSGLNKEDQLLNQQQLNNMPTATSLSNEKVLWIEEWIKSLAELASNDSVDYQSAYEVFVDDDAIQSVHSNNFNMNFFQDVNTVCTEETSKKYNHQSLKYHTSTRKHQVQLVRNHTAEELTTHTPPLIYNSFSSPLENLKNIKHHQQQRDQIVATDENVCLADVQKFLKKMDINEDTKRPLCNNTNWYRNSWAPDVSTFT